MPVSLTNFLISQVRVAPVNAATTLNPAVSGTFVGATELEYLVLAQSTGKLGIATFNFVTSLASPIKWDDKETRWKFDNAPTGSSLMVTATSPMDQGIVINFRPTPINPANPDISISVPVINQNLLAPKQQTTDMINPPILKRQSGLVLRANGVTLAEGSDFVQRINDGLVLFTRRILGEVLVSAAAPGVKFLQTASKAVVRVSPATFVLRENGIVKIENTDFALSDQGLIELIQIITGENLLGNSLLLNPATVPYPPQMAVRKNGIAQVQGTDFTVSDLGGFVSETVPLFEKDVVVADYDVVGPPVTTVTGDLIVPTPARFDTIAGPFTFTTPSQLNFKIQGIIYTVNIPAGSQTADQLKALVNVVIPSTASSLADGRLRVESTEPNPNLSTMEVVAGSANSVLGLTVGVNQGGVAKGGETALQTSQKPILLRKTISPKGQTFINFPGVDLTANYQPGRLFSVNADFYVSGPTPPVFDGIKTQISLTTPLVRDYANPTTGFVTGTVIFLPETNSYNNVPVGSTKIVFTGVDLTARYVPDKFIRLGTAIFQVGGSQLKAGNTEVSLKVPTIAPILNTTLVTFTDVTLVAPGGTRLNTRFEPLLTKPFTLRKNGNPLVFNTDYKLNQAGNIDLTVGVVQGDSFNTDYVGRRVLALATQVTADYTTPSPLAANTKIDADYNFLHQDQFWLQVILEQTFYNRYIKPDLDKQKQAVNNPASSGPANFQAPPAGNDTKGVPSKDWNLWFALTKDNIAKKFTDLYSGRAAAFFGEKKILNGVVTGANDGPLLETQIDAASNDGASRLFPQGYTKQIPLKVPYLMGSATNDDGSTTGGTVPDFQQFRIMAEQTALNTAVAQIPSILAITTYTGGAGPFNFTFGVNDVLNWARNGNSFTKQLTPPAPLTFVLTAAQIQTQINAVDPGAITIISPLTFNWTTAISVSGSANAVLNFNAAGVDGSGPFTFTIGSTDVLNWTRNGGSPKSVTFQPTTPPPFTLTGAQVQSQVNASDPGAISVASPLTFSFSTQISISGTAKPILGFATKSDRYGSVPKTTYDTNTATALTQETQIQVFLNQEDGYLNTIRQESLDPAFTQAGARLTKTAFFRTSTTTIQAVMTTPPDFDNNTPVTATQTAINSRLTDITNELTNITNRLTEIAGLITGGDTFLANLYAWITIRVHKASGYRTGYKRELNNQNNAADQAGALGGLS